MKYKRGQELVCTYKGEWHSMVPAPMLGAVQGPAFNEIVTCDGYNPFDTQFLFLKEYSCDRNGIPQAFYEECFEPLVSTAVLEKELTSISHKAKV